MPGVGRQRGAAGPATKGRADRRGGGEGDFGIQRVELFGLAAGQSAGDVGAGDCARASADLGDGQGVVVEGEGRGAGQIIGWHDEAGSARAGTSSICRYERSGFALAEGKRQRGRLDESRRPLFWMRLLPD